MCFLSDSEIAVNEAPLVDRTEKAHAISQMLGMFCIYYDAKIAPIRQYTTKQTKTKDADWWAWLESEASQKCSTWGRVQISCDEPKAVKQMLKSISMVKADLRVHDVRQ